MPEKKGKRRAKRTGAIICAMLFGVPVLLAGIAILISIPFIWEERVGAIPLLITAAIILAIAIGIAIALIQRLKEIKQGEEDAAEKY